MPRNDHKKKNQLDERRQFVRKLARNPDMEEVRENISIIEQKIGGEVTIKNLKLISENLAAFGAQNGGTDITGAWALKKIVQIIKQLSQLVKKMDVEIK